MGIKTGVGLFGEIPIRDLGTVARDIEAMGYDNLWFADERFYRDVYVCLSVIAQHTDRLGLGISVTNPYTRHPALTALASATIDEISGGRLKVGIGAGGSNHGPLGISREKPLAAIREMTELMRTLWRGEKADFHGKVIHLNQGQLDFAAERAEIPVYIAARGPETLKLAGQIGDGAIIGALAAEGGIRYAMNQIRQGAAKAGRSVDAVDTVAWVYTCISENSDAAKAAVAKLVVNSLQNSRDILERIDVHLPADLQAFFERTNWSQAPDIVAEAAKLLTPEILDQFSLAGTVEEVARKLEGILAGGVDEVAILPFAAAGVGKLDVVRRFRTEVMPAVTGEGNG